MNNTARNAMDWLCPACRAMVFALGLLGVFWHAPVALAQTETEEGERARYTPPNQEEEDIEEIKRILEQGPGGTEAEPEGQEELFPDESETGLPGIELPEYRPPRSSLVREGAFLTELRGYVHALESGGHVFVFDADEEGMSEPPMLLMPSMRLMEMQQVLGSRRVAPTFLVNGQVFVYRGRNYLRVEYFKVQREDVTVPAEHATAPEQETDAAGAVSDSATNAQAPEAEESLFGDDERFAGPTVEEILQGIETAADRNEVIFRPVQGETNAEGLAAREGAVIVMRRGRLERNPSGGWSFASDSDVDIPEGDVVFEGPVVVLPCLNLEAMEELQQRYGQSLVLLVSGVLTAYESQNYLLPTMFMVDVDRSGNITSAQ